MIKWEYKELTFYTGSSRDGVSPHWYDENTGRQWDAHELMDALGDLGDQGWELAAMSSKRKWAILKRIQPDG